MGVFGYRKPADLPALIPVFPLAGAILFPRGQLPLNIFEPRYLNMVDDALASDRLVGMIQPAGVGAEESARPDLSEVGTIGRLTSFTETDDGRYLVTLTGICRFNVVDEAPMASPYRRARVTYDPFSSDLKATTRGRINRDKLRAALRRYVDVHGFSADWSAVDTAPPEALVNAVSTLCPFDPPAKQALLEAPTLGERCAALIALLEMETDSGAAGPIQ